jgi:hypothetical protein
MRAQEFIVESRAVENSIIAHALAASMGRVMKNAALKSIPFAGPLMGFYFAYDRYKNRPDDYMGMALEVATGLTSSLGGAIAGISVIVTRDVYYAVVQDLKKQTLPEPEHLKLTGNLEDDLDRYPTVVNQIRQDIQKGIAAQLKKTAATAKELTAQSKIDRNLMPAEYDSGPLQGWTHPMVTKAFNQRSATGREYK